MPVRTASIRYLLAALLLATAGCASSGLSPGEKMTLWSERGRALEAKGTQAGVTFDEYDLQKKGDGLYVAEETLDSEECMDPEEIQRERFQLQLTAPMSWTIESWTCDGEALPKLTTPLTTAAPPADMRCEPTTWVFHSEQDPEWELELDDECMSTVMVDFGDGYAVDLFHEGDGLWSGSQLFMSHPPHDKSLSLRWIDLAEELVLLEYDEVWEEWDEGGHCYEGCIMECEELCFEDCEEYIDDDDAMDECMTECMDPCDEECGYDCEGEDEYAEELDMACVEDCEVEFCEPECTEDCSEHEENSDEADECYHECLNECSAFCAEECGGELGDVEDDWPPEGPWKLLEKLPH